MSLLLAHFYAALHNLALQNFAAQGVEINKKDYKTAEDFLVGESESGKKTLTDPEAIKMQLMSMAGL